MCVSKSWNSLIKNPSFVSTHLSNNLSKNPSGNNNLFLVERRYDQDYSLHFDDQEFSEYTQLQNFPSPCFIIGSCNGLLCSSIYVFYNPTIRRYVRLPNPRTVTFPYYNFLGFGFDSIRNDYKLLNIICSFDAFIKAELYSLNNNSWKILAPPKYRPFSIMDFIMVFVNGIVHCIAIEKVNNNGHSRRKALLLGFDMNNDVFKEILLPESLSNLPNWSKEMYVVPYDVLSSIAVIESVCYRECNVWVMKKYGVVETWTKLLTFKVIGWMEMPKVLGFGKNGAFFRKQKEKGKYGGLITSNADAVLQVVLHDQKESNETTNKFGMRGIYGDAIFSFRESLVLLDHRIRRKLR